MANIYICILWHMHQPFYKDLVTGEYKLPWTRMHALKDYYGMVKILEDFPDIHQTFNLVPSMLEQIREYASGNAVDPFFRTALKPAEDLSDEEKEFILVYFFQANEPRMIRRYPRYGELLDEWRAAGQQFSRARRRFGPNDYRDLQVLSQLAWFDEIYHDTDGLLKSLVRKARHFAVDDQAALGRKQIEVIGNVVEVYREFSLRGQIEISTTPFYHPILPLLCDSDIAGSSHPYVPLPARFRYPQDADYQLRTARSYMEQLFGNAPTGLWPSEGSVSDEALELAADAGFRWFGTDNGVLGRTLHIDPKPEVAYKPFVWKRNGRTMHAMFRDHYLSDLVGFVYSRMGASEAAEHFLARIRENCRPIVASGRDAVVPVFLDGENAWEYYDTSGRPFLSELYRRISQDDSMEALTVSEALERVEAQEIGGIFPGSWINANFDVWIGAEEDNRAWEYLLRARQMYDRVIESAEAAAIPEQRKKLAFEELLIAEGSDWCWWYGPEHQSANDPEFDALFRGHLANVYTLLGQVPPDELSRPIAKFTVREFHEPPAGPVRATIDGEVSSYFEWMGAGVYRVMQRTGAMHGHRFLVNELRYGSDGQNLFLRIDFLEPTSINPETTEVRVSLENIVQPGTTITRNLPLNTREDHLEASFGRVYEVRLPLSLAGVSAGHSVRFQVSIWQSGLPMEALPPHGWIDFSTAEPVEWVL